MMTWAEQATSRLGDEVRLDREAFLQALADHADWVDRHSLALDPYTAADCVRRGWVERRVAANGARQYRITLEGMGALAPSVWRCTG